MTTTHCREELKINKIEQLLALGRHEEAFQSSLVHILPLDRCDCFHLWRWTGESSFQMPADNMKPLAALNDGRSETETFKVNTALDGKLVLSSSPGSYSFCKLK